MSLVRGLPPNELGTLCPVCGFNLGFSDFPTTGAVDAICPSCGFHFGQDDLSSGPKEFRYLEWRRGWIDARMPWRGFRQDEFVIAPPVGWDPVLQLKCVKVNLSANYASWLVEHPEQVWDNRAIFLARMLGGLGQRNVHPAAIEALWDGDTSGWFLRLSAVVQLEADGDCRFSVTHLGDFQAQDEVALVDYLGRALAEQYGVPFFFPSPAEPEDDCPHWWQQDQAVRCSACNLLIMRTFRDSGLCYRCYLQAERQRADASLGQAPA